jgi:hypothetical protein
MVGRESPGRYSVWATLVVMSLHSARIRRRCCSFSGIRKSTHSANRADQAFAIRIRLWGADRRGEDAEMHQRQRSVYGRDDGVAVVNKETVRFVAGHERLELLRSTRRSDARSHSMCTSRRVLRSSTTKT